MADDKIIILTANPSERLGDVTQILDSAGFEVCVFTTKEDLLEHSRRQHPDLIIKDILSLAVCDVETIKLIRTTEEFGSTPILVIGEASETSVTVVEVLNAGADGYLKLPIDSLILVKKITQLIERTQNEKIIGNRENYLRALIENGTDIITVVTTRGKIIYESPSIEHRLGYRRNELIGRNCLELVHADDLQTISEYYAEGIRQSSFSQLPLPFRFKHKNGSWRVLESTCNFVEHSLEELVIVINSRDITRRRSEEKASQRLKNKLIEAEDRINLALKSAKMIWWEWNPRRDKIIVADNFAEIYGVPHLEKVQDGFALLHPDDQERHTHFVRKIADEGGSYHSEFRIIRQDNGETVWLEETATAFLDEKGAVQKVLGVAVDITPRKNSETAIRQSEERFKKQYKELPVAAYTWKKSGDDFVFEDFNDISDNIAQKKISRYLGMTATEFFSDLPELRRRIEECFEEKKTLSFEMPYVSRATGETRQLVFNLVFLAPDFVMIYTLDVTEYNQTINSLKMSENRFQMVARATSDVLWDWNLANDDVWWNENLLKAFKYREEDVMANVEFWFANIHPADSERVIVSIKRIIETDEYFWSGEYRFRRGDGSYANVFDRGYVERDQAGKAVRMIGAMTDMSKRKQAENELLESKERLTIAQQVANLGSFEWDFQTDRIITSKQLEKIYGADKNFNNDFDYWIKFVHPEDVVKVQEAFQQALDQGELYNSFRIFSADYGLRWLQCRLKVFYDDKNQPARIIGVNLDITERKLAEEALQKSREQLAQSQKLESVGRLAGGIAHDFNNMLTAINGYSELVLRNLKEADPNRRKVLEIKKAGERSAELTKQLLAFSRRQVLQPKLIDLNQIVADMSQLLKRLIGEDISLTLDLHKDACCVMADPGQISQVIMNLVVNSRDAMPEGGNLSVKTLRLHVDEEYTSKHSPMIVGEYILLSVRDTGTGIGEENLQYIFEPFFTTKKVGTGTGLGLSTVYGIIKQSNGYIWVNSEIGRETTFEIFLPHVAEEVALPKPESQEKLIVKGNEKILLVEDEESVRKLLSRVLKMYGYNVTEAENGLEALRVCRENDLKFDLLLTDVIMPQMSGHKLSEELAKIYPQLKILYMSGYIDDKATLDDKIILDQNFVSKPIAPDALADKIRQLLDSKD